MPEAAAHSLASEHTFRSATPLLSADEQLLPVPCQQIAEHDCPAMRLNDRPRDRETETDAARIAAARTFQSHERLKDPLELVFGQSRTPIRDGR